MSRLTREFYARDTIDVARELLGQILVHRSPGGLEMKGRIVETEAYLGAEDPACHTFGFRRTPRTETMYGEAGLAYVYFIYGVHFCLNVVTVGLNQPEAVLIRAIEPLAGFPSLDVKISNGPGKLCRAMGLTRAHDGLDLVRDQTLYIEVGVPAAEILTGARVGLSDRYDAFHWPLRFGVAHSPALSRPEFQDPS